MRIVFVSNYFNHHQKQLCDEFYAISDRSFVFIETQTMDNERVKLGWSVGDRPDYLISSDDNKASEYISEADFVIWGDAPFKHIKNRLRQKKIVFRYSERLFKKKMTIAIYVIQLIRAIVRYIPYKNEYLLCASAYAAEDFYKVCSFRGKAYRWGYFPPQDSIDLEKRYINLFDNDEITILWVGRFIDWKHPELMCELAEKLNRENQHFQIYMIGTGKMEDELNKYILDKRIQNIHLLGSMKSEAVRDFMKHTDIFISTSDSNEGWGAVVNEAMNSGCAVIANNAVGSAHYLINDGKNGLTYQNGNTNDLYEKVIYLLQNRNDIKTFGENAYDTITHTWNAKIAAQRLIELYYSISGQHAIRYNDGPCSKI